MKKRNRIHQPSIHGQHVSNDRNQWQRVPGPKHLAEKFACVRHQSQLKAHSWCEELQGSEGLCTRMLAQRKLPSCFLNRPLPAFDATLCTVLQCWFAAPVGVSESKIFPLVFVLQYCRVCLISRSSLSHVTPLYLFSFL